MWEVRGRLQCNSVREMLDSRELESRSEMQGCPKTCFTPFCRGFWTMVRSKSFFFEKSQASTFMLYTSGID